MAGETFGLHATAMFRPPNNPYIAKYILSTRRTQMSGLMPSRRGASIRARPHPRSRRQHRRAGRPVVPERRSHDLLRPAMRDQPADPQTCPAIRLRRLSRPLPAATGQPLPPWAGGQADAAARRRRQGRRRRHRATPQRRRRALDTRGSGPMDVVPQALEVEPATRQPDSEKNSLSEGRIGQTARRDAEHCLFLAKAARPIIGLEGAI